MEKVIPTSLNYADIKPEAIENMVKLVRFTPTANVTDSLPNDVVRFHLQSNGFFDPYSAYIYLEVDFTPENITLPSDADMTQREDFIAARDAGIAASDRYGGKFLDRSAHSFIQRLIIRSQGTELERIEQYDVMAAMINDMIYSGEQKVLHHFEGFPSNQVVIPVEGHNSQLNQTVLSHCGDVGLTFSTVIRGGVVVNTVGPHITSLGGVALNRVPAEEANNAALEKVIIRDTNGATGSTVLTYDSQAGANAVIPAGTCIKVFCIPIYSGIIGVCMPDKKLIPLSLLPLELEFALNPHAIYSVGIKDRAYKIKKFEIFAHMLFFEQEIHRSLEQVVAQQGIFIHFNTFYLAPITVNTGAAGTQINSYASINVHFKSIDAVHFVYIYAGFETEARQRKLHFVTQGLTQLQIRNGTELIPSEPIRGDMRKPWQGRHTPFLVETYKGWNKMHDPLSDGALHALNYCQDTKGMAEYFDDAGVIQLYSYQSLLFQQAALGRCQYAISLEGEELGKDRSTITGRKGLTPFDINVQGSKGDNGTVYTIIFVRADMVVFVRPDLVVTTLGR